MSAQAKNVIAQVYAKGNGHIAGKHSLTGGELVCFAIAAAMIMIPATWAKIPFAGKVGSPAIALALIFIAFVVW